MGRNDRWPLIHHTNQPTQHRYSLTLTLLLQNNGLSIWRLECGRVGATAFAYDVYF